MLVEVNDYREKPYKNNIIINVLQDKTLGGWVVVEVPDHLIASNLCYKLHYITPTAKVKY